jgi:integrase
MLFLDAPQAKQFLNAAAGHRLYALFGLAVGSGMRQGELLGLHWPDIDLDKGLVTVHRSLSQVKGRFILKEPKSMRSRRSIKPPQFVLSALQQRRLAMLKEANITAPVFCMRTGQFVGKSNLIRQVFKPIIKRANDKAIDAAKKAEAEPALLPDIRFHDLRHTHATSLLAQGHSIKAVSQRLGDASIELTLRVYAHVLPTDDEVPLRLATNWLQNGIQVPLIAKTKNAVSARYYGVCVESHRGDSNPQPPLYESRAWCGRRRRKSFAAPNVTLIRSDLQDPVNRRESMPVRVVSGGTE